jgi:hypothetical protein
VKVNSFHLFVKSFCPTLKNAKHFLSFLFNQNGMRFVLLLCPLLFLFSCTERPEPDVVVKGQSLARLPVRPERVMGMYSGEFKGSPLCIVLNHVTNEQARGYDLHKGISRTLAGVVDFSEGRLHLYLVEPGDSRFDGQFHLAIDTATWKGEGKWKSFVTGTQIPFRFQKREIKKEGGGQVFVDALSNYITLKPDGSVTYHFQSDSTNTAEPLIVTGRYKKAGNKVLISWQKNRAFPSGRTSFYLFAEKAFKSENYVQQSLRGEGKIFNEMIFE